MKMPFIASSSTLDRNWEAQQHPARYALPRKREDHVVSEEMNMETLPTTYALRPVQKQGWNLQIGVHSANGDLLYIGKWDHSGGRDLAIYDNADSLLVTGVQRSTKPFYLWSYALMRDGTDACVIGPDRLFSREVFFNFSDGSRIPFWRPMFGATFRGISDTGWRYEAGPYGSAQWDVSIWGLQDDLIMLSALIFSLMGYHFSQYD